MKKKITLIFLLAGFFTFISCTDKISKQEKFTHNSAAVTQQYVKLLQQKQNQAVKNFVNSLSVQQKLSQLFIENLEGCTNFKSYETFDDLIKNGNKTPLVAGGYLFFSYNIAQTRQEQKDFSASIKEYCNKYKVIPPFLAVDQEGGYVNRLKKLNTKLPPQETVASSMNVEQAFDLYCQQALQMKDLGFHMNLAPVMEVCTPDNQEFLDGRSFGNLEQTVKYGKACINGYENNGVSTVIKHFPGNTNTDPHTGLPEITLSKEDLYSSIQSFTESFSVYPDGILMSHARTSAIDSEVPSCLSKIWVTDLLRNQFGYDGIIFSDDIFMGALADNGYPPEKAAVMAIEAGVDCIMISEKRFAKPARFLLAKMQEDEAFEQKINTAVERIIKYKISHNLLQLEQLPNGEYEVVL